MTYSEFISELSKGKIRPAYFFSGEEEFLIETGLRKLIDAILTPEERDFNFSSFYGRDSKLLPDALAALPIFAERRVTVVKQAQQLTDHPLNEVIRYLQSPPEDGCLILWADKLDKRSKFYKQITKSSITSIECNKLNARELTRWIGSYISRQGKKLDQSAVGQLTSINWPNLYELVGELDKLVLMIGDKDTITIDDIQELGGGSFPFERWKLTDSIGMADMAQAMKSLNRLLQYNIKPIQILSDLNRMFLKLWLIESFTRRNKHDEAKQSAKLHPFVFKRYAEWVRRIGTRSLEDSVIRIADADYRIKTGLRPAELEINLLVTELTRLTGSHNR